MLMTHYRQPIDWTVKRLEECEQIIHRWQQAAAGHGNFTRQDTLPPDIAAALQDDLNTTKVIAALHERAHPANLHDGRSHRELAFVGQWLGVLTDFISWKHWHDERDAEIRNGLDKDRISNLIAARLEARKAKNWAESDRIRDELAAQGIQLKDSKNAKTGEIETTWEVRATGVTEAKQ